MKNAAHALLHLVANSFLFVILFISAGTSGIILVKREVTDSYYSTAISKLIRGEGDDTTPIAADNDTSPPPDNTPPVPDKATQEAQLANAKAALNGGNYALARSLFEPLANQGHREAQFFMGRMLYDGLGSDTDYSKAYFWEQKAADQGSMGAMTLLGTMYELGRGVPQDDARAFALYKQAAEGGATVAQGSLGRFYEEGRGTEVNLEEAELWYRKAAGGNDPNGQYRLGRLYDKGLGIARDPVKAVEWYRKAAEDGLYAAQCALGDLYVHGAPGVPQDFNAAIEWYHRAADRKNADGQFRLGDAYANGWGVAQDYGEARAWYTLAAEQGNAEAQSRLGDLYFAGLGVKQNLTTAAEWYLKAGDKIAPASLFNLASLFRDGAGVERDDAKAVECLRASADQGFAKAQFELGLRLEEGRGVPKNSEQALAYFEKAAKQGDETARRKIAPARGAPGTAPSDGDDALLAADDFATIDNWGRSDAQKFVKDRQLIIKPEAEYALLVTYRFNKQKFEDADVRVTISQLEGANNEGAGVIFWNVAPTDLYLAAIQSDGLFYVQRRIGQEKLLIVSGTIREQVRQGLGKSNALRVVTRGKSATIYINDQEVAKFRGFADGPGHVGLYAESGKQECSWAFSNFSIHKAPPPETADAPADESLQFADDFSTLDPAWGGADQVQSIDGNRLLISPLPDKSRTTLYRGNLFGDMDLRVKASLVKADSTEMGGIIYWVRDNANFHFLLVNRLGDVLIGQNDAGKFQIVSRTNRFEGMKAGVNQINELRVVVRGGTSELFVNDNKVGTMSVATPAPGMIGIYAESSAQGHTYAFSDLTVRKPTETSKEPATPNPQP